MYKEAVLMYPTLKSVLENNINRCEKRMSQSHSRADSFIIQRNLGGAVELDTIFTIVARNYFAYARVLMDSLRSFHPDSERLIVVVDAENEEVDRLSNECCARVISSKSLGISEFPDMALRYDVMELSTAIKPYVFRYLLQDKRNAVIVYLDPDIKIFAKLHEVERLHHQDFNCVVTPHITSPYTDKKQPDEHTIIKSGVYNCGFISFKRSHETDIFIRWWCRQLATKAYSNVSLNLFTDQRWIDLITSLLPRVAILRDNSYNVAYWNLHERKIDRISDQWFVNKKPLVFFHFSGVNPNDDTALSKHQDRFMLVHIGNVNDLVREYIAELKVNEWVEYKKIPYGFDILGDGQKVSSIIRKAYARLFPDTVNHRGGSVEKFVIDSMHSRASVNVRQVGSQWVTELMLYVYNDRPDLQRAFGLNNEKSCQSYMDWFFCSVDREYGLSIGREDHFERSVDKLLSDQKLLDGSTLTGYTRFLENIRISRADLRKEFPVLDRSTAKRFMDWAQSSLVRDYGSNLSIDGEGFVGSPGVFGDHAVNIVGYSKGEFGLGEHSRATCSAFTAANIDWKVTNFDFALDVSQRENIPEQIRQRRLDPAVNIFHINADQMHAVFAGLGTKIFRGKYNIGYWAWELENAPSEWSASFDYVDEIWVPSEFVRESLRPLSGKPIIVMPECVSISEADFPKSPQKYGDEYCFLFSFDMGSFVERKNPWAVISAFQLAFDVSDCSVRLIVKVMNESKNLVAWEKLRYLALSDQRIIIVSGTLTKQDYMMLMGSIDCFVSLHRSEGFGRGPAEAMLMGKPVIVTGYSGVLAYVDEGSACLVDYDLVEVKSHEYPHWENNRWAAPRIEHAANYMKKLRRDPDHGTQLGMKGKQRAQEFLSPQATGTAYADRLRAIGIF
jgi:glycosyltransferase involved in cell wall biosynthesis